MKLVVRGALGALVCGAAATAAAVAQGTPATPATAATASACDVGGGSGATAKATLYLQRAANEVQAKKDASKDLKQAIAGLTAPTKDRSDSVTRAYYLGQAYILMAEQPGVPSVAPASTYGIATNPTASVDLLAAADSAFTLVEATHPGCRTELAGWRQQKPWLDVLNGAINALNAEKYDSAQVLAQRALTIDRRAPYAYSVLAAVANHRKDYAGAAGMLQKAIAAAGSDSLYADARANAMFDLGNNLSLQAESATGAARTQAVQQAVQAWEQYIPTTTKDAQVAHAIATAGQLLQGIHDSTAMPAVYAPVLAAPAKYGEQTLLNAGVVATRAGRAADAATLFAAVLQQNPNERDALKNLAASYIGADQPQKVIPVVDRLVTLDPNNSDNWLLYAYAYSGLLKGTRNPRLTKAYTDSLVKYNTKSEKLTPRVTVTGFTLGRSDSTVTLQGTIENRAATPKTAAMQVEFLDRTGAVVATGSQTVGPIPAKGTAPFTITTRAPNAVAYRYHPLT